MHLVARYVMVFWDIIWASLGLYREMSTNTQGQSNIVIRQTNVWNKVYYSKQTIFFYVIKIVNKDS